MTSGISIKEIFTEDQVTKLAQDVAQKVMEVANKDLQHSFYEHISDYLYEHYENIAERIENKLIAQITEGFIEDPSRYKYQSLRRKIYEENKEALTKVLNDEEIQERVEDVILGYTFRKGFFPWLWLDGVVNVIIKHWDKFITEERVKNRLIAELDRTKRQLEDAKARITELVEG